MLGLFLLPSPLLAQDRDAKVRNDRKAFEASNGWIDKDLSEGVLSDDDVSPTCIRGEAIAMRHALPFVAPICLVTTTCSLAQEAQHGSA